MSTYRVRVLATASGQKVHNVLHVAAGDAPPQGIADDFADAWRARILPDLHNSYTFGGVELENIATDDAAVFSLGTTGPTQGGRTGAALPTFVCASVRLQTDRRGRAGAGRFGLGPLPEEASDAASPNHLAPIWQTALSTAVTALRTDIESSGGASAHTLAVVSYYRGVDAGGKPIPRAEPLISLVGGSSVNQTLGTRLSRHPSR